MHHQKTDRDHHKSSLFHRYTSAEIRLVFIFCSYSLTTIIGYSAYSVVLKRERAFAQALDNYFDCQMFGSAECDRNYFEDIDPTPVTIPLTNIVYIVVPVSTLLYVANFEKLKLFDMCKTKLKFSTKSSGSF